MSTILAATLGFAFMAGIPAYFVLQPMTLFRLRGGWRMAAAAPLLIAVPTILFSLYALSQDSNLWPLTFIFFAPIGSLYLVIVLAVRHEVVGTTGL